MDTPHITAVCVSEKRGIAKREVGKALAVPGQGLDKDAHAGMKGHLAHRQVSLLAQESADVMTRKGIEVKAGGFGENLRTRGIAVKTLPIGAILCLGDEAELRVTQIGKECHSPCAIYHQVGDCIMPREGIFAEVLKAGEIETGQAISAIPAAAVITVSDRSAAGEREDKSGPEVRTLLEANGFRVAALEVVPDDRVTIEQCLRQYADKTSVIVTTGGTGIGPRDVTPEATRAVITQELPGMAEAMRRVSFQVAPGALLSRAVAGVCGQCVIVNVPGSPKGARECLEVVLPALCHSFSMLRGEGHGGLRISD